MQLEPRKVLVVSKQIWPFVACLLNPQVNLTDVQITPGSTCMEKVSRQHCRVHEKVLATFVSRWEHYVAKLYEHA